MLEVRCKMIEISCIECRVLFSVVVYTDIIVPDKENAFDKDG